MKVLYAGDSAIMAVLGLEGAEIYPLVDQVWDAGTHLTAALEGDGDRGDAHARRTSPTRIFPRPPRALREYDAVILSDIGHDTLVTYPGERRMQVPMGPNRLKEIARYVESGGGLIYCGGYFTYQGHYGKGRWYGTPVAEILPLEILPLPDDRIEAPEGAPIFDIDDRPSGDRRNRLERPADLHGIQPDRGNPERRPFARDASGRTETRFLAVGEHGSGRVLAMVADPAPHWGSDFVRWPHYGRFWNQAVRWVAGRDEEGEAMKLTFEVWPNMPWGRLEAAGPAWNSWGDKPLVWCAERIAECGYDGIDVIFAKIQEIPKTSTRPSPRSSLPGCASWDWSSATSGRTRPSSRRATSTASAG